VKWHLPLGETTPAGIFAIRPGGSRLFLTRPGGGSMITGTGAGGFNRRRASAATSA